MSPHQTHLGIVVGVDGSPSSTLAVEWAARDADMRNVPIKLAHIVAPIVAAAEGWSDIPAPSDYTRWQEDARAPAHRGGPQARRGGFLAKSRIASDE